MRNVLSEFVSAITTMSPKRFFYNGKDGDVKSLKGKYQDLEKIDNDLLKLFIFHPTINEYNKINIIEMSLSERHSSTIKLPAELSGNDETIKLHLVYSQLLKEVNYSKVLQLFLRLKRRRVNNKRVTRTILEFIFGENDKLSSRAVKYRVKINDCLRHAWGDRRCGSIREKIRKHLCGKEDATKSTFIKNEVLRYRGKMDTMLFLELVYFCLRGNDINFRIDLLRAYKIAQTDLKIVADKLPYGTLLGFRNKLHKDVDIKFLMKESMKVGKTTTIPNVDFKGKTDTKVDYSKVDPILLIKEMYDTGVETDEMFTGYGESIDKLYNRYNLNLGNIGIVFDNSQSMIGSSKNQFGPISKALVMLEYLKRSGKSSVVYTSPFLTHKRNSLLPKIHGSGDIGSSLLNFAKSDLDIIFVISNIGLDDTVISTIQTLKETKPNLKVVHLKPVSQSKFENISGIPVISFFSVRDMLRSLICRKTTDQGNISQMKKFLLSRSLPYVKNQLSDDVKEKIRSKEVHILSVENFV